MNPSEIITRIKIPNTLFTMFGNSEYTQKTLEVKSAGPFDKLYLYFSNVKTGKVGFLSVDNLEDAVKSYQITL